MVEEVDRLRGRVKELERKVMEKETPKTFVVTNHPEVYIYKLVSRPVL